MTGNYDWSDLSELYSVKMKSPREIAIIKHCSYSVVCSALKRMEIPMRSRHEAGILSFQNPKRQHLSGARNPNWKGGRRKSGGREGQGSYISIKAVGHHRANKEGYILEHILVWEKVHNKPLPEGWVIHHINGIKTDNRPKNLLALPYTKHHSHLVNEALKQRIRELEEENKLLSKALDNGQMIFNISEN